MRRISTLAVRYAAAFVLLISTAFVREARAQEVLIKGGVSSANIAFIGDDDADSRWSDPRRGGIGGVSFFITRSGRGGLQLEALIHQRGARGILRREDAIRFTDLEVPLILHVDIWQHGDRGVYLGVGPSVAFNLRASYADEGVSEDIREDIEKVDVGLNVGGGVEIGPLVIDARYTWGFRNLFNADEGGSYKHRTFAVTAGLRLRRY